MDLPELMHCKNKVFLFLNISLFFSGFPYSDE